MASPIRVFGADLADLADLRLPAEANYLSPGAATFAAVVMNDADKYLGREM